MTKAKFTDEAIIALIRAGTGSAELQRDYGVGWNRYCKLKNNIAPAVMQANVGADPKQTIFNLPVLKKSIQHERRDANNLSLEEMSMLYRLKFNRHLSGAQRALIFKIFERI